MKKQAILITLCIAAVLVSVSAVSAATDWYVNDTGGDDTNGDGSAIAPYLTIGKGVNSAADGDTVIIAPGEYTGTGNKNIVLDKSITIQGAGEDQTTINCEDSGHAFTVNEGKNVIIKDLTIENGLERQMGSDSGGAIINAGDLTVQRVKFIKNEAAIGGAIYNTGTLTVNNCIFTENTGSASAAIENDDGGMTVTGSTFTGNTVKDPVQYHSGIICTSGDPLSDTLDKPTVITGNTLTWNNGVGISVSHSDNINIHFNRIEGNTPFGLVKWNSIVEAQYNWWGTNTPTYIEQPEQPTTYYDIWNDNSLPVCTVNYYPWLILSIKADPSTIYTGQSSSITADLYSDSAGGNHQGEANKYLAEIPITFSTNLGTLNGGNSLSTVLKFGTVTIPLLASQGPGLATITGSVDRKKVQATVNILQAPVTPQEPTTPFSNEVNAATVTEGTVGMQETGLPIAGLILAIFAVFGGLIVQKRK